MSNTSLAQVSTLPERVRAWAKCQHRKCNWIVESKEIVLTKDGSYHESAHGKKGTVPALSLTTKALAHVAVHSKHIVNVHTTQTEVIRGKKS